MSQDFKQILLQKLQQQTVLCEQANPSVDQIQDLISELLVGKTANDVYDAFVYMSHKGFYAVGELKKIVDKLGQKGIACFVDSGSNVRRFDPVKIEKPSNISSRYSKPVEYRPHELTRLIVVTKQCPYLVTLTYKLDKFGLDDRQFWDKIHKENVKLVHRVVDVDVKKITYAEMQKARGWELYRNLYRTFDWVPESDKKRWADIDKQDEATLKASEREGSAKFTYGT